MIEEDAIMQAYKEAYRRVHGHDIKVTKRIKVRYVIRGLDEKDKERTASQMEGLAKELIDSQPIQGRC